MRFAILGPTEVSTGGRPVPLGGPKQRALLAFLLLHANQAVSRDRLIDALWGECPPPSASESLDTYIYRLRKLIGHDRLARRGSAYVLSVEPGELDADMFELLVSKASLAADAGDSRSAARMLAEALALWRGPALADVLYQPFAGAPARQLEERRLEALESRIEADLDYGAGAALVPELEQLVACHPLRERQVAALMLALYRAGRQADALAEFQAARGRLVDELGLEPGPELCELERRILQHDPVLATPRRAVGGVHGFPAVLTSFVGRAAAVDEVAGLVGGGRLVTVTGPGGVGKTRLAGEVARRVAGRFADGVWLVELAPVADGAQVAAAVAAGLGVREQPGVAAAEAVAGVLARQQLLLVLDNCEHVIGAAAELCAGLLGACDEVRVLASSREPLAVAGEARYRLVPLSLPGAGDPAGGGGSEAVVLFADRARRADAHFELDGQTGAAVARIVERLDGMPLAIELAAARVEGLGVAGLLDGLDDRFALLAGGDRLAAGRHRSLAATVDWSYQLLDERERRVFRYLSVFPGPFTLEGAEAVAGPGAGPVVVRLVECSLLSPPRAGPDGRARYLMLESLRAYGAGLLAGAGEQDAAAAALARWALRVAQEADAGLQTVSGELAAARWLDAEDATTRQVLAWAREHDAEIALRLAVALGWWWLLRGRLAGNYLLLREIAGRAEPGSDRWCAAQFFLGWAAVDSGDLAAGLDHFTALRDATGDGGPSRPLADALFGRAWVLRDLGRVAEAADDGRRALALAREIGSPAGELRALATLSLAAERAGDLDSAVRLARQAAQITQGIPGQLARMCSRLLARALTEAGDLAAAEEICAAGLAQSRDAGDLWNQQDLLTWMVVLDLRAGRFGDAAAHLQEVFQIGMRTGTWYELADALDCCGQLCAATGRFSEAITLWAATDALLRQAGFTPDPAGAHRREELLRKPRQALGPAPARAAQERGAVMSPATAAEFALLLTAPGPPQAAAPPGLGRLSARERELITLVARGRTDAQIAQQLYISIRTVHSHLDRIRDKTGCRRRADLTRLALTTGLI